MIAPSGPRNAERPASRVAFEVRADEPFRGELLSALRLAERASALAAGQRHTTAAAPKTTPLIALLNAADERLREDNAYLHEAAREYGTVSPAAEWLLDNHYLVDDQIATARADLPPGFGKELPRLTAGALAGFPRIYEAIVYLVAHTDSRIDEEYLVRYVMGFQDASALSIGEVWAVPIMLRVALVENVRRLSGRVVRAAANERAADVWANRLIVATQDDPDAVPGLLGRLDAEWPEADPAFMARLAQRLGGQEAGVAQVGEWLEKRLAAAGIRLERVVFVQQQAQAADQVSIANSITSMRFLEAFDWKSFFERTSLVEQILREDPAEIYDKMDFASRDRYRHALEEMAKRCPLTEIGVAEAAVSWAGQALAEEAADTVRGHVGYYLISGGRYGFERSVGYRRSVRERLYRGPLRRGGLVYSGLAVSVTAALTALLGWYSRFAGVGDWQSGLLMLLALIPLSDLSLNVVNRMATSVWPPRTLPKIDYRRPLSDAHRTLVVVPALLTSAKATQSVIDNLEVVFLANADPNVHLALLGDLRGASEEVMPGDQDVISAAVQGIDKLNQRYGDEVGYEPFHLFVRGRVYSETEGAWLGWERKRGSLVELNRRLRGESDTTFTHELGDAAFLPGVTFVITLDADTVLPRDGARRLVGTIAHPLNRAVVDFERRWVRRGYGLVQPRVGMSLPAANRTFFAWLYSGVTGIDPYSGAVSDTYQDVFGEGSFTGKGVYEVDVFNAVLAGRIPEATLLSHDLLEGNFLRTALASDVEVLDDYPSTYPSHAARLHRWVRGDWQTLPWLGLRVPAADGRYVPNQLSALHRWKLVDNLRRSLVAPTLLLLIVSAWLLLPEPDLVWPAFILSVILFPAWFNLADSTVFRALSANFGVLFESAWEDLKRDVARSTIELALLPHQAYLMTDAVVRSLYRVYVSRRYLLEWTTAADVERALGRDLAGYLRRIGPASVIAVGLALPGALRSALHFAVTLPLLVLWLAAPVIAWRISQPLVRERRELTESDRFALRRVARKTWRFFEDFVTPEDHWLTPDNFQEDPKGEVARRTSPTNMGLQLLSTLSAYDLGYLPLGELVDRVSRTLSTLAGMERFRGHFYNWYDTTTLQPLRPGYISTVDSGNLAGNLIVLRVGLLEASESPLVGPASLAGLADTVHLAIEDLLAAHDRIGPIDAQAALREMLDELLRRLTLEEAPRNLGGWRSLSRRLLDATAELRPLVARLAQEGPPEADGASRLEAARDSVLAVHREVVALAATIQGYAPWAELLDRIPTPVRGTGDPVLRPLVDFTPSLVGLAEGLTDVLRALDMMAAHPLGSTEPERAEVSSWAAGLAGGVRKNRGACVTLLAQLRLQADIAREMWEHTDFRMLYDSSRQLFSIGFNTAEGRLDNSYYDMLASECRLASFLAVAKGDVPQEHWFRLGRGITSTPGGRALLSWSASMFEYLMPLLVMKSWPETLLDMTYYSVVKRQIQYGRQRGVPWGVSESAFNAKDVDLTYQYQAFGVPGLGLKRGLSEDVVVAPYASALALPIEPRAAVDNLAALAKRGAEGRFGYYEAIDYTPGRVPAGTERAVVKAYFAHHQGMSLVAMGNELTGYAMRERFHLDPVVQSAELLLQERVPRRIQLAQPHVEEVRYVRSVRELPPPLARSYPLAGTPVPATHFLSNGRYSVMVTNGGGGYSRCDGVAITRYREDVTRDCWGQFIYIRDDDTGELWSAAYQPVGAEPDDYHVTFSIDKAEYRRTDGRIDTHTEVIVSPEEDVEVRRITITNHGREVRHLRAVSYFELALAPQGADQAHKAFSNLFVETEALDDLRALLFTRRPRSSEEGRMWGLHVLACDRPEECEWSYETDRAVFLGRLRGTWAPEAMERREPLSRTVGAVLDPVCAVEQRVVIPPGETAHLAFATGMAGSRERAVELAERYRDIRTAQRAADLAWTAGQIELRDLGISAEEAVAFQRLASRLLLTDPYSRLKVKTPTENRLQMSGLWTLGISGDLPILLVRVERLEETQIVRQALLAHQYWRHKGLVADLVILNARPSGYADELDDRLRLLVRTGHALQLVDKPGGVFLRRADQMAPDVLNLLLSVARATLAGDGGPLELQLEQRAKRPEAPDRLVPKERPRSYPSLPFERQALAFDNGFGGFDLERGEYVVVHEPGDATPAPWVNVVARPGFGTLVSEAGIGCTWAENSHENRITTWNNDAVSDGTGESFYVRDEETGEFWSPTPLPVPDPSPCIVRHGRGYTRFERRTHGIEHELTWFVDAEDPVRVARLRLTNLFGVHRRLSVTHLVEWVLGSSRSAAQQRVVTGFDEETAMLTAHNWFNADFPGRVAFLACDRELHSFTASRTEFLGRNRHPGSPAAMRRKGLGGVTGRFHDNCGALMTVVELEPGASAEVSFFLGQADDEARCREIVRRMRRPAAVARSLAAVGAFWDELLGAVRVQTPDAALDALLNGPLLYQVLSCRVWGRTALYQSSGAFGFRDQLQDVLSVLWTRPELARAHVVEACRHQFERGDVMHWWQPSSGRGVRTRFVDDRHWLPLTVAEYVKATGDTGVLDEEAHFILGQEVPEGREDVYTVPEIGETGSVYEHCVRALDTGFGVGPHGLPLMGGGDWNDGMNRVGVGGSGESVWMAWFLNTVMSRFAPICESRGDHERAERYRAFAEGVAKAAEEQAWDGAWYRRAYFDDGTPLGTRGAEECRIDAIAQAWAVISGAADGQRAMRAMESVEQKLVRWDDGLVQLLDPPFDRMPHDPGYIKGYVPGVRENGGQYTHAAVWTVLAYLLMGEGDEALALLDLINPVNHTGTREDCERYRVEPYALAADVYAVAPHVGRGGWTWYTGSASWFYRVAVHDLLGLDLLAEDGTRYMIVDPCIPKSWPGFGMTYRWRGTTYRIEVANPRGVNRGVARVEVDGAVVPEHRVPLREGDGEHHVVVTLLGG
ncbi:MAG: hypothetical protein IBX62_02385 [Coriobacteriia bacterium]|nr:hypothetical protein [Coriobacteriia bacterium]